MFNNAAEEGASFLDYDAEECETGLDALFHDMSNTERNGSWLRTWCGVLHCEALTACWLQGRFMRCSRLHSGGMQGQHGHSRRVGN